MVGIGAASFIFMVLATALFALVRFAIESDNLTVYFDSYLLHILAITFYQSLLSTVLSIGFALLMAKALSMVDFKGKALLLKLMPITFILPTLVVVTGLLSVYGKQGLISVFFQSLNLPYSLSIYGLQGILLAHVFLNFPYACCLFYRTLISVPVEHKQLAAQLNFSHFAFVKLIEWPLLRRQILPMAALIFMLCFSSFAVVLALGGGPKFTTIEVAIYQSIRDFDIMQAVVLSALQIVCCVTFILLMQKLNQQKKLSIKFVKVNYQLAIPGYLGFLCRIIIWIGVLFIFLPMLTVLVEGIYYFRLSAINQSFLSALMYSILIALGSAMIAMLLGLSLLWTNSRLLVFQQTNLSNYLMMIGSLILVIPSMVLASGLFLLLFRYADDNTLFICLLVMLCNGLMALPFVLKNLAAPMYDVTLRYWQLSQSLNITGLKHFYLIEFKALKKLIMMSFAFSMILSLGDFGVIALFGGQSVITLPYYLYEQISHYYYHDSMVTAAFLLILSLSILVVIDDDRT